MTVIPDDLDDWMDTMLAVPENPVGGAEFFQLGLYCDSAKALSEFVEVCTEYGADRWTYDVAVHNGELLSPSNVWQPTTSWWPMAIRAHMAFNYQLIPGKELELMYWEPIYKETRPHPFAQLGDDVAQVCWTYKVEDTFTEEQRLRSLLGMHPSYKFMSIKHDNPAIDGLARYRDTMYDTYDSLGYNLRFSAKLPHEMMYRSQRFGTMHMNWRTDWCGKRFPCPPKIDSDWYPGIARANESGLNLE
jgi:hypothetical protein